MATKVERNVVCTDDEPVARALEVVVQDRVLDQHVAALDGERRGRRDG
jgi:hypothetical protein